MRPTIGTRTAARRRCADDTGTALIEASLAVPIIVALLAGIVDFGMLYERANVVYGATHATARTLTTAGASRGADFLALRAFNAGFFTAQSNVTVTKVVIYKPLAEGSSAPISATCFSSATPAATAKCNVYTASMLATLGTSYPTHFGPDASSCGTTAWDRNWCPLTRLDQQDAATDWVGVYVELTYVSVTRLWLRSGVTFTDRAVMRIEPMPAAS